MPINPYLTHECLNLLNQLLQTDPTAITNLIKHHTHCNQELAEHPTVQVRGYGNNPPTIGLLGLLNGLCGTYDNEPKKGFGPITATIIKDGEKILEFHLTRPADPEPTIPAQRIRELLNQHGVKTDHLTDDKVNQITKILAFAGVNSQPN